MAVFLDCVLKGHFIKLCVLMYLLLFDKYKLCFERIFH